MQWFHRVRILRGTATIIRITKQKQQCELLNPFTIFTPKTYATSVGRKCLSRRFKGFGLGKFGKH